MFLEIKVKKVIVTGGSRGIGAATVRKFTSEGCSVAFIYKNASDAASSLSATASVMIPVN